MSHFDSEKWIEDKKLELINLLFENEFGIPNFKTSTKVINFDELQTEDMRNRINRYRAAMSVLFKTEEIRSVLDYYYLQQDKKPALNLLKQILKYYGYEFSRSSEYQGNYAGKKVYKSKYTIVLCKPSVNNQTVTPPPQPLEAGQEGGIIEDGIIEDGTVVGEQAPTIENQTPTEEDQSSTKKKIIAKLIKTYHIDPQSLPLQS
jgi:hypothetical protein